MSPAAIGVWIGALALSLAVQDSADVAYQSALAKLEAGDAAGAEASARQAIAESLSFVPEREIEVRPEKGILFDDMILAARQSYRSRRARYFRALGDALSAQEKWRASRNVYARTAAMVPDPEVFLLMADDPDLSVSERRDYLLDAYLVSGSDRLRLEGVLLETGIFRSRNALKASLDARRFAELEAEYPDLELVPGAFPRFQTVTDAGTLNTGELYRQGSLVFVYVPVDTCAHCSEQLDGITIPVLEAQRSGIPVVLTAFVPEVELPIARRIVRLLAMPVGVGRIEGLPSGLELASGGELRVIARGGMTQIRIPMSPEIRSGEIRRRVDAIVSFLNAPDLPTEEEPEDASIQLVGLVEQANEHRTLHDWVDKLELLEAGPAPLEDLYEGLRQLNQRIARDSESRDLGFEMLEALGGLDGAGAAKTRTFAMLGADIGDRLLEEVRALDPDVRRSAPPGVGVFNVAVTPVDTAPRRVLLQRSFQRVDGVRDFNFLLEDTGDDLSLLWFAPEDAEPRGVQVVEAGAVFHYADGPDCVGLRVAGAAGIVYEDCAAAVIDGEVVEARSAIVDDVANGPLYYRRNVTADPVEGELDKGLRLFEQGDMAGAAAAFDSAMSEIDPEAPYDASDLVYNRARALEELGRRQEALALYRSVGDVAYQYLVDEGAGRIEGAPR
jgi:tetratricopeptide (TPR) repeat protein